jgi:tetratricopeptide (TPR) repeat protein
VSPQRSGIETSIRQQIANGKSKTALDNAKDFHKRQGNAASEGLLIDAYLARIEALSEQNLAVEAKSLIALVRERFPSAKERLDALNATAAARGGNLDELLRPLNDPGLSAERRAPIEQFIQSQVTDLAALADCAVLPAEHGLRKAAAAIDTAFRVVTSGPVTDEQIALAEVSHRSPLAPWKLLIRAIACFYRDQDESCEECLAAIKPDSAPGRLVPAMRAMMGAKPAAKPSAHLKPAEAALVSRTCPSVGNLPKALEKLDRAFAHDAPAQIFNATRAAVRECMQSAPNLLPELRRTVCVAAGVACLDMERTIAALEGAPRRDAAFFRDLARALEHTGDSEDLMHACEWWDCFRKEAVIEGWFAERSMETAALYLHMAGLLGRMPPELLRDMQSGRKTNYVHYPGELYGRACAMDPHPDAFSQWLRWSRGNSVGEAENVARAWNKALPSDIEPLLFLMEEAEKRNAFPTALSYLDQAERIDAVNSTVRTARVRLLAAAAIRHLQQKKPRLALERLAEITLLPQSQQGDRPAFLAALQFLICLVSGDRLGCNEARIEAAGALDDGLAAELLFFGCAMCAKRLDVVLPVPDDLTEEQRSHLPASIARVIALVRDVGIATKFGLPISYLDETEAQFQSAAGSLNVEQIRLLGEMGIATKHLGLTWAASVAGIDRGGPTEAYFLLLRARALPDGYNDRYEALTAAAAELGRLHRDMEVVDRAVEAGRDPYDNEPRSLTADQARGVLAKEKASPEFPSRDNRGPDYSSLFDGDLCMCPKCRRERGESFAPNDEAFPGEEEMERSFYEAAPKHIPPEILPSLFEVAKEAFYMGQDPQELLEQILGPMGGKKKKGKRR